MKRLLVVANPFPPLVSAGNQRVLRFLKHLPEQGWEPTVLTVEARGEAPVPDGLPILRAPVPVPRRLLQGGPRSAKINRWLFIPDPYAGWVVPAAVMGRRLLARERYDAIFSSAPRATVHITAAILSRRSSLPWLADYRDPWLNYEYRTYPTRCHRVANALLEGRVLRTAAGVTAINRAILEDVLQREPGLRGRSWVLPNGFDRDETPEPVTLDPGTWYVHTGRLYGRYSQTAAFLQAFAGLPTDARMLFLGGDERRLRPLAKAAGVSDRVVVRPFVPHGEALGYQRAAAGLVLIAGNQAETTTSKVFEYFASGRPIFAVAPRGSAVDELLGEVGGGVRVDAREDLRAALVGFHDALGGGSMPQRPDRLAAYDVVQTTATLARALESITAR